MSPERKAKFRTLAKRLKNLSESDKLSLVANNGIRNVDGHSLSLNNTCLLLFQANGTVPTVVGGYRQWQKADRQVRRGEHGMMIWFPTSRKEDPEDEDSEDITRFFIGTVFDISQTEEKPEY